MNIDAVLLDLDGTLVDTAPDLCAVLNRLLREEGRRAMPYATARNEVSNGSIGLINYAYGLGLAEIERARLRERFLALYAEQLYVNSRLFIELSNLYEVTNEYSCGWGIVTNKPSAFTLPLLDALGLTNAAGCVVCGDTLEKRKPHPDPLQHAARELGVEAANCVYVGDAERDISAGRAADMATIAAAYGYIRLSQNIADWGANAIMRHPRDLGGTLRQLP